MIAFQEKMMLKLSNNLYATLAENDAHERTAADAVQDEDEDTSVSQEQVSLEEKMKMFVDEPFSLYGGSFMPSES